LILLLVRLHCHAQFPQGVVCGLPAHDFSAVSPPRRRRLGRAPGSTLGFALLCLCRSQLATMRVPGFALLGFGTSDFAFPLCGRELPTLWTEAADPRMLI
jgi:hypothetical protein